MTTHLSKTSCEEIVRLCWLFARIAGAHKGRSLPKILDMIVLQLLFSNWVRWMILIGIATNNRKCPARALCAATGQLAGPRLSQVWVGGPVAPNLRFIRRLSPSTLRCFVSTAGALAVITVQRASTIHSTPLRHFAPKLHKAI